MSKSHLKYEISSSTITFIWFIFKNLNAKETNGYEFRYFPSNVDELIVHEIYFGSVFFFLFFYLPLLCIFGSLNAKETNTLEIFFWSLIFSIFSRLLNCQKSKVSSASKVSMVQLLLNLPPLFSDNSPLNGKIVSPRLNA